MVERYGYDHVKTFRDPLHGTLKHLKKRIDILTERHGENAEVYVSVGRTGWGAPKVLTQILWNNNEAKSEESA